MNFNQKVYLVVSQIPRGKVLTYGRVAKLLDIPRGARTVGWALAALPTNTDVPWHRVINSEGKISNKNREKSAAIQRDRLESEGVQFDETGHVKLDGVGGTMWRVSSWEILALIDAHTTE